MSRRHGRHHGNPDGRSKEEQQEKNQNNTSKQQGGQKPANATKSQQPARPKGKQTYKPVPYNLALGFTITQRAHYEKIHRILTDLSTNHPITMEDDNYIYEAFGRHINCYETMTMLKWLEEEMKHLPEEKAAPAEPAQPEVTSMQATEE